MGGGGKGEKIQAHSVQGAGGLLKPIQDSFPLSVETWPLHKRWRRPIQSVRLVPCPLHHVWPDRGITQCRRAPKRGGESLHFRGRMLALSKPSPRDSYPGLGRAPKGPFCLEHEKRGETGKEMKEKKGRGGIICKKYCIYL